MKWKTRPGPVLAVAVGLGSVSLIRVAWVLWPDTAEEYRAHLLLHLGSALAGIALTVGLVDYVLERRAAHDLMQAARPPATGLADTMAAIDAVYKMIPQIPTRDSLEAYRLALDATLSASRDLNVLAAYRVPAVSGALGGLGRALRTQLHVVTGIIDDIWNEAGDIERTFGRLKDQHRIVLDSAEQTRSVLREERLLLTVRGIDGSTV